MSTIIRKLALKVSTYFGRHITKSLDSLKWHWQMGALGNELPSHLGNPYLHMQPALQLFIAQHSYHTILYINFTPKICCYYLNQFKVSDVCTKIHKPAVSTVLSLLYSHFALNQINFLYICTYVVQTQTHSSFCQDIPLNVQQFHLYLYGCISFICKQINAHSLSLLVLCMAAFFYIIEY